MRSRLRWPTRLRDPGIRAAVMLGVIGAAGFLVIGLAWLGAADRGYVVFQLPWVVSGGMVGIGLIGLGFGLLDVHLWRRQAAARRAELGQVVRETSELAELVAARVTERHAAKKRATRKAAPRKTAARKATPRKTVPRKTAARRTSTARSS